MLVYQPHELSTCDMCHMYPYVPWIPSLNRTTKPYSNWASSKWSTTDPRPAVLWRPPLSSRCCLLPSPDFAGCASTERSSKSWEPLWHPMAHRKWVDKNSKLIPLHLDARPAPLRGTGRSWSSLSCGSLHPGSMENIPKLAKYSAKTTCH